jgi:transposase-like protein
MANLVKSGKDRTTISYARYLMSVHMGRMLTQEEHVDHINGIKTDDRIENFQLLTREENAKKYNTVDNPKKLVSLVCPICGKGFDTTRQKAHKYIHFGESVCCSKHCGWKKASISGSTPESTVLEIIRMDSLGISAKDIANFLHISKPTVYKYLKGA